MSKELKKLIIYTSIIFVLSIIYYAYVVTFHPPSPERETFISEIGEEVGEVALWAFYCIYLRTLLKLLLGKGSLSKRLLPDRTIITHPTRFKLVIGYLDRTHIFWSRSHCTGSSAYWHDGVAHRSLVLSSGSCTRFMARAFRCLHLLAFFTRGCSPAFLHGPRPTNHWNRHWYFCLFWPCIVR